MKRFLVDLTLEGVGACNDPPNRLQNQMEPQMELKNHQPRTPP